MSEGGKTARSDLIGGAGWVVFGLVIVTGSVRMDRYESMGAELYTMPGFVPGMIGGLVALLGLVLMLRGWMRRGKETVAVEAEPVEPLLNRRIVITMLLTLMLTSKGVAGVPRASLVILAATLASYNLPLEGVTLILGVDAIMDMGRTMTNVIGNCLASVVVAKWEGEFREPAASASA